MKGSERVRRGRTSGWCCGGSWWQEEKTGTCVTQRKPPTRLRSRPTPGQLAEGQPRCPHRPATVRPLEWPAFWRRVGVGRVLVGQVPRLQLLHSLSGSPPPPPSPLPPVRAGGTRVGALLAVSCLLRYTRPFWDSYSDSFTPSPNGYTFETSGFEGKVYCQRNSSWRNGHVTPQHICGCLVLLLGFSRPLQLHPCRDVQGRWAGASPTWGLAPRPRLPGRGEAHTPGGAGVEPGTQQRPSHVRWHAERVSLAVTSQAVTLSHLLNSWGPRSIIWKMGQRDATL